MTIKFIKTAHALSLGKIEGIGQYQTEVSDPGAKLETIISTLVGAITAVAGIAFLIYFLLGAISWITSGGDQQKVQQAQKQITDALTGLVITIVAYFVVSIVATVLGIPILNPAQIFNSGASSMSNPDYPYSPNYQQ